MDKRIAIIGGGMAGCAMAYTLKNAGLSPVLYEAGPNLAGGASGNEIGLYNPRFTAEKNAVSDYFTAGFSMALRVFEELENIDWDPCGALHLINDDKKATRFGKMVQNWGWSLDEMRIVDQARASKIAGVDIQHDALYLPRSGSVSPRKLCKAYMTDIEYYTNQTVDDLALVEEDIVILACGPALAKFYPNLPIGNVRGQITDVAASDKTRDVNCAICYGGYFSRANEAGEHIVGSTFQRWLDHGDIIAQDDADNIAKLAENVPGLFNGEPNLKVIGHRASVRATSKDHFPMVGQMARNVYVSGAHGSHGILSSLIGAQLIADMILDRPKCLPKDTIDALSPLRF